VSTFPSSPMIPIRPHRRPTAKYEIPRGIPDTRQLGRACQQWWRHWGHSSWGRYNLATVASQGAGL